MTVNLTPWRSRVQGEPLGRLGVAGLTALTALWWFAAGQPLVAALA